MTIHGHTVQLGNHESEEEAARKYDSAARHLQVKARVACGVVDLGMHLATSFGQCIQLHMICVLCASVGVTVVIQVARHHKTRIRPK